MKTRKWPQKSTRSPQFEIGRISMKVAVFVKASLSSEAGVMPSQQLLAEMGAYNEELFKAGIMKDGVGLHPTSKAVRVRFTGNDRQVIDGPFAETNELVAGYWIWEVKSMDEAVDWLKKCPNPMPEESEIEIRPIFEADDFGEEFTSELRVREEKLEAALAMEKATVQPYLFFSGRCEEALEFYKTALDAKVVMVMRFNESPEPTPPGMLASGFENKVMHCSFQVGGMTLMASDGCDDKSRFDGFRLALSVPTEACADHAFSALAEGGKIDMPLAKTFWSPRYGMVTDKFGVAWMVMVLGEHHPSNKPVSS
jgi:uncharacterized glyoxalase superfamily protein PhnB